MQTAVAARCAPLSGKAVAPRAARKQVVVSAMSQDAAPSRRAALALVAAAVVGLSAAHSAQANAEATKNGSAASMSSFNMEGTKKMGASPGRKAKLMAKARAAAEAAGSK